MEPSALILVCWLTLHRANAFSISARPRSGGGATPMRFHRRRLGHALSSTLPVEDQTAEVVKDRDMYDLYTSVALLDPDWFQEYIVRLVGEQDEIVNDAFFRHVEAIKVLPPKDPPQSVEITASTDFREISSISSELNEKETEHEVPSTGIPKSTNLTMQVSFETEQRQSEFPSISDKLQEVVPTVSAASPESIDLPTIETGAKPTLQKAIEAEHREPEVSSVRDTSEVEEVVSTVSAAPPGSIDILVNDACNNRTMQSALETEQMEPEAVSMGVTSMWEDILPTVSTAASDSIDCPPSETRIHISEDANTPVSSTKSNNIVDEKLSVQPSVKFASLTEIETIARGNRSEVVGSNDAPAASIPVKRPDTFARSPESRVVVYWNDEEEWKPVNLTTLLQLGYTESEIVALQSTALHCIVRDRIPKPRAGVPSRWKAKESELVQIVERSLVSDMLRSSSVPLKPDSAMKPTPVDGSLPSSREKVLFREKSSVQPEAVMSVDPKPSGVHSDAIGNTMKPSSRERSRVNAAATSEVKRPESTERRRRSSEGLVKERPIYNGRPSAGTKRPDSRPPPPKSGIWPDVDTFRRLLRDEASFRLRILGNDWSDVVKDEIDWRNDLYTSWLWTLHHGIGEPFVPSRSDRARRQPRDRR